MFTIFHLEIDEFPNNHYTTGRTEQWRVVTDSQTNTLEKAQSIVMTQSALLPEFNVLAVGLSEKQRVEFLKRFCFDDNKYLVYRRYFIDHVPKQEIRAALTKRGVRVI